MRNYANEILKNENWRVGKGEIINIELFFFHFSRPRFLPSNPKMRFWQAFSAFPLDLERGSRVRKRNNGDVVQPNGHTGNFKTIS